MKRIKIGRGELEASAISLGCMRMDGLDRKAAAELVDTARQQGIDFFDHADIYGGGKSEEVFAEAVGMSPAVGTGSSCSPSAPCARATMTSPRSTSSPRSREA